MERIRTSTALKEAMNTTLTTKLDDMLMPRKVRRAYDRAFQEIALLAVDPKVKQDQIGNLSLLATAKAN